MINNLIAVSVGVFIAFFLYSFISPTPPPWTEALLNFAGIIIAALMVIYQLQKQHLSNLTLQKENRRDEMRLKIFEELSTKINETSHSLVISDGYLRFFPIELRNHNHQIKMGIKPVISKKRFSEWLEIQNTSSQKVIEIIYLLEKYEIVSPDAMKLFRLALCSASHDVREAHSNLTPLLINYFPREYQDQIYFDPPSDSQINEIEEKIERLNHTVGETQNYIYDMNYEFQKIFLKNLFDNDVTKRQPLDPKYKVLSTDPAEMRKLMKYFDNETPCGLARIKAEKNILDSLQSTK